MLIPNKFNGYSRDGIRLYPFNLGGGGGGGTTQTTSTVQNTNVPAYAQPYVESMLGATQNQLFNTSQVQTGTDDQGNAIMGTQIDSFKPYQAYGGTYDAQGNQIAYDPTKGIAGFTPDQLKTQQGIMGLQVPDQYRTAGLGMESVYNDMKTNAYTAPTNLGYTADTAKAGTAGASQNAVGSGYTSTAAKATDATSQGYTSRDATSQGYTASEAAAIQATAARLGIAPSAAAAQLGIVPTATAAQSTFNPTLQNYQMGGPEKVATRSFTDAGTAEAYMSPFAKNVLNVQNEELDRQAKIAAQGRGAQAVRAGAFGGSRQAIENAEADRNLAMMKNMNQAQGMQSAFQQAQQQFNAEQGYGLQGQIANQQAGLTVGQQNLGAKLGVQQLGTQTAAQIELANLANKQQVGLANQALQGQYGLTQGQMQQQTNLANQAMQGQYGLTQGQFDQQANMQTSSQAQTAALANAAAKNAASQFGASAANQAQLANAAAANQASQFGAAAGNQAGLANAAAANQIAAQNAAAASQASQFGAAAGNQASLANQAASNQMAQYNAGLGQQTALANQAAANQAAQFGAGQNLASAQTTAQYGLAGNALQLQAAQQYAGLGQQQLAAQQGILSMQSQVGAQQQALDQAAKNQAVQDYANAQQYPLMQLGTMSNMLRGLPMQASTTNQYAATPSTASQIIGAAGAGASIYNATKPGGAAGGLPSEFKYAKGGITSVPRYDMGGEVESQLESMDEKGLQAQARESSSPTIRKMAQRMLRERQMSKQPQSPDAANVQYQAAQPQMPSYKPGGIVAFVAGGGANEEGGEAEAKATDMSGKTMEERLAMPPPSAPSGIMAAAPITQVPASAAAPSPDVVQEAMRQRNLASAQATRPTVDVLKDIQAEREALGVGENVGRQEYRAQQMAERANMKDEQERQRNMRLAEFFASWGSTPGPTLVAGMNALKQSIPNLISDEKDAKKARKEADKIIYDIDEATRLEKLGMIDRATALKEKAAVHAEDYNKYLLTFQSQRESDKRAKEVADTQAAASVKHAEIMAASHGKSSAAADKRADEATRYHFQTNAASAKRALENLDATIAKEAKDTLEYNTAKRMVSTTKMDKKQREKAEETVKQYDTNWEARRKAAKEDLALAQEQLGDINAKLGYGKKPDSSATPPPAAAPAAAAPSVTISGQTYTKPANMTEAQWDAYKKSQGVK
jgi:hypothetical protein